jgi:hypothetical protein
MRKTRILDFARKLYNLSNSSNIYEAKLAKSKLDQLIKRHNINIDKITPNIQTQLISLTQPISVYKEFLYTQVIITNKGILDMRIVNKQLVIYCDISKYSYNKSLILINKILNIVDNSVISDIDLKFIPSVKFGFVKALFDIFKEDFINDEEFDVTEINDKLLQLGFTPLTELNQLETNMSNNYGNESNDSIFRSKESNEPIFNNQFQNLSDKDRIEFEKIIKLERDLIFNEYVELGINTMKGVFVINNESDKNL